MAEEKDEKVKKPNAIRKWYKETIGELRKVSWPTREHVRNLTVLVFAISLSVGLYITILDAFFRSLVGLLPTGV